MPSDARISAELPGHPKTKKLIRRAGPAAGWFLVRLFLWASVNRSDGDLAGLTDEDIELAIDWDGAMGDFVAALESVGFLDGVEGERTIHDWHEHNPWAAGAEMRSAKARWNAAKRHHGHAEADRLVPEYAAVRIATSKPSSSTDSNAGSNTVDADSNAPSPSPSPSPSLTPSLRSGVEATAEPPPPPPAPSPRKNGNTLRKYLDLCKAEGRKPLPQDHFIRGYCRDAGITEDMLQIAWIEFRDRFTSGADKVKLQKDWPAHFANSVKGRWAHLWFTNDRNEVEWTATGLQAKRVIEARMAANQATQQEADHAHA